jgi:hypothetical protein
MDYAEARVAFFQPRSADAPPPRIDRWAATPARQLRDAIEPIATICFWSEPAYKAYEHRGLDFLQGYVWGRSCVLGEPEGAVAAAAFGGFDPGLIEALYDAGRSVCTLADMRSAKESGAVTALQEVLGDPAEVDDVLAVLRRGIEAIHTTSGRAMSAGLLSLDWPDDGWGQLWHACSILREYRGDGHIAAYVAYGLDGLEANLVTELQVGWDATTYAGSRGWSAEAMAAATDRLRARGLVDGNDLSENGRTMRDRIESITDSLMQPVVDALGDDLPGLLDTLNDWSRQIIDHGWFPPDPYKRASG